MSGDVLKEFLVSIGYEVDGSSEQKLKKSLTEAEKQAKRFADDAKKREKERAKAAKEANEAVANSVKGLAATVFGAMTLQRVSDEFARVTKEMEGLYYTAQRSGTAVGSIRGLSDAFSRMGLQAQDAVGAVESLARVMRTQPGARGLLASYGISGKGDQAENLIQLAENLKKRFGGSQYGYATAARIAGEQFGVSENVFFQLWNNPEQVRSELEKSKKIRGDLQDENSKAFQQLSNTWRDFLREVEAPLENFEAQLAGPLSETLKAINEKGLAPFIAGLGTILGMLVSSTMLMGIGRLFGFGAGAAAGAAGAGAAEAAAGGGLLGGLLRGAGRVLGPLVLGAVATGHGYQTKEQYDADPNTPATKKEAEGRIGAIKQWIGESWLGKKLGIFQNQSDTKGAISSTPLKDLITGTEGTANGDPYNTVYAYGKYLKPPKPITEMTLSEVLEYQRQGKIAAGSPAYPVGRGQFIRSTLQRLIPLMGLDPNKTKMTPEIQERMFDQLIRETNGDPATLRAVWDGLRAQGVSDAQISKAWQGHLQAIKEARAASGTSSGTWDWVMNHMPSMAAQAATFDNQVSGTPLAPSSSTTNDNSRSVTIGDTNITVHGSMEADMAAALISRNQRRLNEDLLSSVQGAFR